MKVKHIGIILAVVSFVSSATNITIYRWVDEKNVVHFSQQQPKHDNYTELSMAAPKPATNIKKTAINSPEEAPIASASSQSECEKAKANVKTLNGYDKIQYTGNDGQVKILGDEQKKQQLEINKKQVEVYCRN